MWCCWFAHTWQDYAPIDSRCRCLACTRYTRAALHSMVNKESTVCHLISIHNIAFQLDLMRDIRQAIVEVVLCARAPCC